MDKQFNWYPVGNDSLLNKVIDITLLQISSLRKSSRGISSKIKKDERQITRHLINALYLSYFSIPKVPVSINMTAKSYSRSTYGYKNIRKVIKSLDKLSLIEIKKGSEYAGKVTRIWSSDKLTKIFKGLGFIWRHYPLDKTKEVIVVRDRILVKGAKRKKYKKITISTPNNKTITNQRNNLFKINEFLSQHCIALDLSNKDLDKIKAELREEEKESKTHFFWEEKPIYSLNFSLVQLRRIYSRANTSLGGRYYGGWWQVLPSKYRPHIKIDDYKTTEVDFSTMSLNLLYAREGIQVPDTKDLYDIGLKGSKQYLKRARELIKKYINAILNNESGRYQLSSAELKELKLSSHKKLKDLVIKYHKPISHFFGTGVGLELMYLDSVIAERLMLKFQYQNIVLLPIHDSFIIRTGFASWLRTEMKQSFKELMNKYIEVKSIGFKPREYFNKPLPPPSNDPSEGIIRGEDLWKELIKDDSRDLYTKYCSYWHQWRDYKHTKS